MSSDSASSAGINEVDLSSSSSGKRERVKAKHAAKNKASKMRKKSNLGDEDGVGSSSGVETRGIRTVSFTTPSGKTLSHEVGYKLKVSGFKDREGYNIFRENLRVNRLFGGLEYGPKGLTEAEKVSLLALVFGEESVESCLAQAGNRSITS